MVLLALWALMDLFAHRRAVMMWLRAGFDGIHLGVTRFLLSICVVITVAGFCEPPVVKIGYRSLVQGVAESEVVVEVDFWTALGLACQR